MLERLFKSVTTPRILQLLLFGGEFHVRELARRTGITPTYVGKELANLAGMGIASERRVGNLRLWSANKDSPVFEDLKRLFIKTDGLGVHLSDVIASRGVAYALVFGSVANGTETGRSDLDLLVVGSVHEDELMTSVERVEKDVGREINYILWREKEFARRAGGGDPLLRQIASNPVIWISGDENGFRQAVARGLREADGTGPRKREKGPRRIR